MIHLEPFSDPHRERIKKKKEKAETDHMFKCQKHLYALQKQGNKEISKIFFLSIIESVKIQRNALPKTVNCIKVLT